MALQNSWPGPSGVTDTTEARKDLAGLIETDGSGVARAGVFPAHTNAIVTARSDMNVDIAAFQGCAVQFGGPVLLANDGTIQLPSVLVSPGSGTNYYVVYVKQNESTAPGTDANNNVIAGASLSTASFTAARSALPAGAVELATVQVPSGVAATNAAGVTITQSFQYTAAEGGVVLVRNSTELAAWSPADGALAYQIDTKAYMSRVGGAWLPSASGGPHVVFARTAAFNFTTTKTILTFDSTPVEGGLGGALSTSDYGTFTCVLPGLYQVSAMATAGGASTTAVGLELFKGSTAVRGVNAATNTISWTSLPLVYTIRLVAGDTISLRVSAPATVAAVVSSPSLNNVCIDYVKP